MKKLKIAILVSRFPPGGLGGGIEIATYMIARHLTARGYEVHVISSGEAGFCGEAFEDGFYIHRGRIFSKPVIGFISYLIHSFRTTKKIAPDLVHAQSLLQAINAFFIRKLLHIPYLAWTHGSDIYLPSKFYKLFYKLALRNAALVVAQTEHEKRAILAICRREIEVVPNGVDLDRFKVIPDTANLKQIKSEQNEKILLFVGTLRPVKGVKYLIQAMNIIHAMEPMTRLLVLGDGEESQRLEDLVCRLKLQDSVIFVGKVANEQVPMYMAAADIFVLPSLSEGFPVVVAEAMASGLPIVTTNVTGLSEIVHDGENGLLVEPENPETLAEKVLKLLRDDLLRGQMSENNRLKAENYGWVVIIDKLEELYRKTARSESVLT